MLRWLPIRNDEEGNDDKGYLFLFSYSFRQTQIEEHANLNTA